MPEAQIAWMPAEERRHYALTGPPPPDWFTEMRPAPWITEHIISEGRKLADASLVRPGLHHRAYPLFGVGTGVDVERSVVSTLSCPRTWEDVGELARAGVPGPRS